MAKAAHEGDALLGSPAFEESLDMTKASASLAAALLALAAVSQSCAAGPLPYPYPPARVAWTVGSGLFGYSGTPVAPPPLALPIRTPRLGCYVFRQHLKGAWRPVEVCE